MRTSKRRRRTPDPLASASAVRGVLAELRRRAPHLPDDEKELVSLLRAAIYRERRPQAVGPRGRRSRWSERLTLVALSVLREILATGDYGRKDARSFVEHYLGVLHFPADVREVFERGDVNLFEAEQLCRLTKTSLRATPARAAGRRARVLAAHLASREAGSKLRDRVDALLRPSSGARSELIDDASLLAVDADPGHVFFELLSSIGQALGDISDDDLSSEDREHILEHGDQILLALKRVNRRVSRAVGAPEASRSDGRRTL